MYSLSFFVLSFLRFLGHYLSVTQEDIFYPLRISGVSHVLTCVNESNFIGQPILLLFITSTLSQKTSPLAPCRGRYNQCNNGSEWGWENKTGNTN